MKEKNTWSLYGNMFSKSFIVAISDKKALFLAFLASIVGFDILFSPIRGSKPFAMLIETISRLSQEHILMYALVIIGIIGLSILLKGALLVALNASVEEKPLTIKNVFTSTISIFPRYLAFECLVALFLSIMFLILSIPQSIVQENALLSQNLSLLELLVFIPILVVGMIVETFGSLYLLFSKTKVRTSFELGYTLFMRNATETLTFGSLFTLLFIFFSDLLSVLLQFVMTSRFNENTRLAIAIPIYFLLQSLFISFSKTSWIAFFRSIAKKKLDGEALQMKESMLKKDVPELEGTTNENA